MNTDRQTTPCGERHGAGGGLTWEVFPNTDRDTGGWFSYVEDGRHYLGGDWHRTRDAAKAHALSIVEAAPRHRLDAMQGE